MCNVHICILTLLSVLRLSVVCVYVSVTVYCTSSGKGNREIYYIIAYTECRPSQSNHFAAWKKFKLSVSALSKSNAIVRALVVVSIRGGDSLYSKFKNKIGRKPNLRKIHFWKYYTIYTTRSQSNPIDRMKSEHQTDKRNKNQKQNDFLAIQKSLRCSEY